MVTVVQLGYDLFYPGLHLWFFSGGEEGGGEKGSKAPNIHVLL